MRASPPSAERTNLFTASLPAWINRKVPRDHRKPDADFRRRRRVVAGVSLAGSCLLGLSLSTRPGSPKFYAATLAVAGTWAAGGLASGPLHRGWALAPDQTLRRPVVTPVLTGAGAFGLFYVSALVAKRIPVLDDALGSILRFAAQGYEPLVLLTTLANGAGEEIFFRGAVYAAVGTRHPVAVSTAVYAATTLATRNPALVAAATVMGSVFGWQRRATGGIQAPILTHLTWATLMIRYLPPLFPSADTVTPMTRRARLQAARVSVAAEKLPG